MTEEERFDIHLVGREDGVEDATAKVENLGKAINKIQNKNAGLPKLDFANTFGKSLKNIADKQRELDDLRVKYATVIGGGYIDTRETFGDLSKKILGRERTLSELNENYQREKAEKLSTTIIPDFQRELSSSSSELAALQKELQRLNSELDSLTANLKAALFEDTDTPEMHRERYNKIVEISNIKGLIESHVEQNVDSKEALLNLARLRDAMNVAKSIGASSAAVSGIDRGKTKKFEDELNNYNNEIRKRVESFLTYDRTVDIKYSGDKIVGSRVIGSHEKSESRYHNIENFGGIASKAEEFEELSRAFDKYIKQLQEIATLTKQLNVPGFGSKEYFAGNQKKLTDMVESYNQRIVDAAKKSGKTNDPLMYIHETMGDRDDVIASNEKEKSQLDDLETRDKKRFATMSHLLRQHRWLQSYILVTLNYLTRIGGASKVLGAIMVMLGTGLGYILDMILLPLIPVVVLITKLLIGVGNWFKDWFKSMPDGMDTVVAGMIAFSIASAMALVTLATMYGSIQSLAPILNTLATGIKLATSAMLPFMGAEILAMSTTAALSAALIGLGIGLGVVYLLAKYTNVFEEINKAGAGTGQFLTNVWIIMGNKIHNFIIDLQLWGLGIRNFFNDIAIAVVNLESMIPGMGVANAEKLNELISVRDDIAKQALALNEMKIGELTGVHINREAIYGNEIEGEATGKATVIDKLLSSIFGGESKEVAFGADYGLPASYEEYLNGLSTSITDLIPALKTGTEEASAKQKVYTEDSLRRIMEYYSMPSMQYVRETVAEHPSSERFASFMEEAGTDKVGVIPTQTINNETNISNMIDVTISGDVVGIEDLDTKISESINKALGKLGPMAGYI